MQKLTVKIITYNSLYMADPASFPGYTKRGQKMNKKTAKNTSKQVNVQFQ
jgi:hypothetical protein